ncbi:COX15/CtaA family protein [Actinomycetospora chlora]|uniref:COX15/CtaA family protein n=2 Tax=Actinomycetospora chlora TaxID=663608 RepID=A0ABP9BA36_9PSEU
MLERLPATPPRLMRGLAMAAVVGQAGIAVTGAVVRVTGSGLGCPTWPQCFPGSLVPVPHPEVAVLHQWVEFGNRLLGILLVVITGACLLAALNVRPHRRRLVWLAATMPLGVVAQAVIGGITVLAGLAWYTVAPHFLVTIPLIWLAVLLVRESSPAAMAVPPGTPWRPAVPAALRGLLVVTSVVLVALVVAGTLVTAAGPHGGDAATPRLEAVPLPSLATAHAHLLFAFLGLLVGVGFMTHAVAVPRAVVLRLRVLVVVTLAQGALGGVQYALGVPEVLVALHVLGAAVTVATAAWLWSATAEPDELVVDPPETPAPALAGRS